MSEKTILDACGDPPLPELGVIEQNWETDPIASDDVATHAARAVESLSFADVPDGGEVALGVGSRVPDRGELQHLLQGVVQSSAAGRAQ